MAEINLRYLSTFNALNNATGTGIVQFQDGINEDGARVKELVSGGSYTSGRLVGRLIRWGETKAKNNEIRQALLTALSKTFGIGKNVNGVYEMPPNVVSRLEGILGKGVLCAKSGNEFKLNSEGKVCSGSPLTERRITQILNKVYVLKAREENSMNEDGTAPLHPRAENEKKLSEVIKDTENYKETFLSEHFKLEEDDYQKVFDVVEDRYFTKAFDKMLTKFGMPLFDDQYKDDHVHCGGVDTYTQCVNARLDMLIGLSRFPENAAFFFRGVMRFNKALQIINLDIQDRVKRFNLLKPGEVLEELSGQIQGLLHPENRPAEQIALKRSAGNREDAKTQMALTGGGFKKSATFSFKANFGGEKDVELESSFTPALGKKNVNRGDQVARVPPLSNLGVSTLRQKGTEKPIISFVRFGQVSVVKAISDRTKDKKARNCVRGAAFKDIARQMIDANPEILKTGTNLDGSVNLPIYRVNMCGSAENMLRGVASVDFEHETDGQKYEVKVTVHNIYVPLDSKPDTKEPNDGLVLTPESLKDTDQQLGALLDKAEEAQLNGADKGKVDKLVKSLKAYRDNVLAPLVHQGKGLDNAHGNRGPEMLRFGSQVALLVSLLGHMPAINCNWGRDRTSAMDSEIKRLALKFEKGSVTDDDLKIQGADPSDQEKKERTEFLFKTGNAHMAKQMDRSTHPINLNQSSGASGFSKMFADLKEAEESVRREKEAERREAS